MLLITKFSLWNNEVFMYTKIMCLLFLQIQLNLNSFGLGVNIEHLQHNRYIYIYFIYRLCHLGQSKTIGVRGAYN